MGEALSSTAPWINVAAAGWWIVRYLYISISYRCYHKRLNRLALSRMSVACSRILGNQQGSKATAHPVDILSRSARLGYDCSTLEEAPPRTEAANSGAPTKSAADCC